MTPPSTRRARRGALLIVAIIGFPGALLAAGSDESHTHTPAAQQAAGEAARLKAGAALIGARQLYIDRCAACHGERGHGTDAAATDFADAEALVRLTRQAMSESLDRNHDGRLAAPLSEADSTVIIGYLRSYLILPAPDADTAVGRGIYSRDCSVCHGDRGDAASWAQNSLNPPPAAFTSHGLDQLTREKMIEAVTFGKKGTAMMPFAVQLSNEEIAATVDYIRAAFMPSGMGLGAGGHDHGQDHAVGDQTDDGKDAPFPAGLAGDPVWGKAFYNANCAECHGPKGDGEGRRAYFMIKKPKDFLSHEARTELDRPKLLEEISEGVTGSTMPSWDKVLTPQQIANVAEYVYRAFLHPDRFSAIGEPGSLGWQRSATPSTNIKKTDVPVE